MSIVLTFLIGCTAEIPRGGDLHEPFTPDAALRGTLTITGSSTIGPLALEIAKRFEQRHPSVRVEVQTGGSSRGIADARSGLADIGMSSRSLHSTESANAKSWSIAQDGVCFIVNAKNPVLTLSRRQLRDIYAGRIDNWKQLGGRDEKIIVINRAAGRSELTLITDYLEVPEASISADLIAGENQQGIKMVANSPGAITYMSLGASVFESSIGSDIKILPLEGVPATAQSVAAGRYPLMRPLLLVTPHDPPPLTRAFVDFARSAATHDLVRQFSYVPFQP